uniref:Uncharacterized protein n=1 Tax=Oryza punctata TaxID=4537 RepID=A0A0E0M259_ORYPU
MQHTIAYRVDPALLSLSLFSSPQNPEKRNQTTRYEDERLDSVRSRSAAVAAAASGGRVWAMRLSSSPAAAPRRSAPTTRLRREALESVLEELRRALDELREGGELGASLPDPEGAVNDGGGEEPPDNEEEGGGGDDDDDSASAASLAGCSDGETAQLCDLLKSTFESPIFFQKVDEIQKSLYQNDAVEQDPSWNIVKAIDLWEGDDLALKKTFSSRKRKGKLRKAWDGTKVIYNVASWSATAIGDGSHLAQQYGHELCMTSKDSSPQQPTGHDQCHSKIVSKKA